MTLDRRQALLATVAVPALAPLDKSWGALAPASPAPRSRRKVFRMAFQIAETGFDPARISDIYSRIVTGHLFEALYGYDPLARPATLVPRIALALPEVNADFTQFTIRLRAGVRFQDDAAFGGRPRELVAEDFVYSLKRFADPQIPSPMWAEIEGLGILGLAELREQASKSGAFDYDAPLAGLRATDRHTLRFALRAPRPRLVQVLAQSDLFGAVAREVVERYGDAIAAHPVGTGPFRLVQWRRSSFIALERNPHYRDVRWDTVASDPEALRIAARLRGRRLPLLDRIEVTPIEEPQPRWLSFLNGEHDFIERLPEDFSPLALPQGRLAPHLARRGMQLYRHAAADCTYTFFNMADGQVGGLQPHRVALRRAISLGIDVQTEIQRVRRGQALPAQSLVLPHSSGFDPAYRSENSEFSPARAKALLDVHGYLDRDGDGFREQPDGSPLTLEIATSPDARSRQNDEQWNLNLRRLGIRPRFASRKWPEQLKLARAGKLQIWTLGQTAQYPDGILMLQRLYGPAGGQQNLARFRHAGFDRLYERLLELPDGAERNALFHEAKRIQAAFMPIKVHVHRIVNDLAQPWVLGYRRPLFWVDFWQFIDIDLDRLP